MASSTDAAIDIITALNLPLADPDGFSANGETTGAVGDGFIVPFQLNANTALFDAKGDINDAEGFLFFDSENLTEAIARDTSNIPFPIATFTSAASIPEPSQIGGTVLALGLGVFLGLKYRNRAKM